MKAVVVAHGDVDPTDVVHLRDADLVIAADGGSGHLERWGVAPHLIVGDLDSLGPREGSALGAAPAETWPRDKDKSDTELAVERAVAAGADEVVVLGALGGARADHAIANTLLLALERRAGVRVALVRGAQRVRVLRGGERAELAGGPGDLVTLLAVGGDATGVRTEGLRFVLDGGTLVLGSSRGLSNEIARRGAAVTLGSGVLLVVEGGGAPDPQAKA